MNSSALLYMAEYYKQQVMPNFDSTAGFMTSLLKLYET